MTKRFLWTIVGACLCLGLNCAGAQLATAPDDWACNTSAQPQKGECGDIAVRDSLPQPPPVHLVKGQTFRIKFTVAADGSKDFFFDFTSAGWLPEFKAADLAWEKADGTLMSDEICSSMYPKPIDPTASAKRHRLAENAISGHSHFVSTPIRIHKKDHVWRIFPIGDAGGGDTHFYCLMLDPLTPHGGSHDGAVHGDS